jgi:hypothetical protein
MTDYKEKDLHGGNAEFTEVTRSCTGACNILRVNFFFLPFLEILKDSAFAGTSVIPDTARNYRK